VASKAEREQLQQQTRTISACAGYKGPPYPTAGQGSDEDVERLLRAGEKLLAIRLYRELHGTDLKTSRLRVGEMAERLRKP